MAGYYSVIFTSQRTTLDPEGYEETAQRMTTLAAQQPGFLGMDNARNDDGFGITVSYWTDLESIRCWREQAEHLTAQHTGREKWYEWFQLRVCRVEREWSFQQTADGPKQG